MEDKKKTLSDYRLKKAREDLQTAKIMLEHQKPAQSVNRSYYAIFHAVRALLAFDLIQKGTHQSLVTSTSIILPVLKLTRAIIKCWPGPLIKE